MAKSDNTATPSRRKDAVKLNLPFYWTSKPCRKGHRALRRTGSGYCVICETAARKRWRAERPDLVKAWEDRNRDKINAAALRRLHALDPEIRRKRGRAATARWVEKNRALTRLQARKYAAANPEKVKRRLIEWKLKDPEKTKMLSRLYKSRRRARKLGNGGSHTLADIRRLKTLQGNRCAYCGDNLTKWEVDHIVPLVAGGSNGPQNLQILCPDCNHSKYARDPLEFAREKFGLLL